MTTKTTFKNFFRSCDRGKTDWKTDGWAPQTAVCRRRQNVVLVVQVVVKIQIVFKNKRIYKRQLRQL